MPAVVFVTTLEPKDGRRDELVGLLAELAKHIRGEPGFMQYSVYRPAIAARFWSSRCTPRSRRIRSTTCGCAARYRGSASSSQRPPPLLPYSNRSRSATTRRRNPFPEDDHALRRARTRAEHLTWNSTLGALALPPRLPARDPVVSRRCDMRPRSCAVRSPARSRDGPAGPWRPPWRYCCQNAYGCNGS